MSAEPIMGESRIQHLERMLLRSRAFKRLFLDDKTGALKEDAEIVIRELAHFCHVTRPSYKISPKSGTIDPLATHVAEGRREVFMRITSLIGREETIRKTLEEIEQ